jgi:hypothetical protein
MLCPYGNHHPKAFFGSSGHRLQEFHPQTIITPAPRERPQFPSLWLAEQSFTAIVGNGYLDVVALVDSDVARSFDEPENKPIDAFHDIAVGGEVIGVSVDGDAYAGYADQLVLLVVGIKENGDHMGSLGRVETNVQALPLHCRHRFEIFLHDLF